MATVNSAVHGFVEGGKVPTTVEIDLPDCAVVRPLMIKDCSSRNPPTFSDSLLCCNGKSVLWTGSCEGNRRPWHDPESLFHGNACSVELKDSV